MTVKELHTFTDSELSIIENALSVAAEEYAKSAHTFRRLGEADGAPRLTRQFEDQADAARALQLKIEASR